MKRAWMKTKGMYLFGDLLLLVMAETREGIVLGPDLPSDHRDSC